jgi:hypothetical protein
METPEFAVEPTRKIYYPGDNIVMRNMDRSHIYLCGGDKLRFGKLLCRVQGTENEEGNRITVYAKVLAILEGP